jgi:hypothetical protein
VHRFGKRADDPVIASRGSRECAPDASEAIQRRSKDWIASSQELLARRQRYKA